MAKSQTSMGANGDVAKYSRVHDPTCMYDNNLNVFSVLYLADHSFQIFYQQQLVMRQNTHHAYLES